MMRSLWLASIWHPDAIPASEGEYARDVKRWVLPTIDLLLILGSFFGMSGGMPTVLIVYNECVSRTAAALVLAFAVGCLVGVAFPRLWALEFAAKCGLVFILLTYALLATGLSASGDQGRWFISGAVAAAAVAPVWRIIWLGRERRRRIASKEE